VRRAAWPTTARSSKTHAATFNLKFRHCGGHHNGAKCSLFLTNFGFLQSLFALLCSH
jgi:hypothetical protein